MYQLNQLYRFEIELVNPVFRYAVATLWFQTIFAQAVDAYNNFFQNPNARTKNRKAIKKYKFNSHSITIVLSTQYPIPNPNRVGNCLRQLTVFMENFGGWRYLNASKPGKLFRSA